MNNRIKRFITAAMVLSGFLLAGPVNAAMVAYENVGFIENKGFYNDAFKIDMAGTYKATLTDFAFPSSFDQLLFKVTTATDSLGQLMAPGSFTFDALPGTYYANLVGVAGGPLDLGLFGVQVESFNAPPVPIPAAIVLLASGLCVLGQMAWRRRWSSAHDTSVTKASYSSVTV